MAQQQPLTQLQDLPTDLIGEIFSQVARSSRTDVRNVMAASPKLATAANNKGVFKNINLRPLAMHPLAAMNKYKDLMEKCLSNGNPEAHYIKGIQEYFQKNNTLTGLQHLETAAKGGYENGIYLYRVIMLCRGEFEEGKTYLDKLGWKQRKTKADQCWRNIKRSLHGMRVTRLARYVITLRSVKAAITCNRRDMENRCEGCYYYKQMVKFVFII